ncbi:hypothetical protein V8G54_020427 [Vigna mungo]|uniref:Uncharacterized protein n=1 Tax=Vigna mungo TaxID=3915 RepID=A0AAQ3RWP3_VIGMU
MFILDMTFEGISLSFEQLLKSRSCNLSSCPNSQGKHSMLDPERVRIRSFFNSPMIDKFCPRVHFSRLSILSFVKNISEEGKHGKFKPVNIKTLSSIMSLKKSSGIFNN